MGAFQGHQPHAGVRTGTGRGDGSAAALERRVSRTGRCDGSQQTAPQPRRGFAGCPRRHGRQVRAMEGKTAAGAGRPGGVSCKGWRPRFCTCDSASRPAGTAASQDVPQPPSGLTGPCVSQMSRDGMGRSRTRDRSDSAHGARGRARLRMWHVGAKVRRFGLWAHQPAGAVGPPADTALLTDQLSGCATRRNRV